jgi:hypothetical protein
MSLAWSAVNRAAGWSIVGIVAWFWLFSTDGPAWRVVSLVAVEAFAALAGVAWYLPRVRAERQWRAALDRYVEREQTDKRTLWRRAEAPLRDWFGSRSAALTRRYTDERDNRVVVRPDRVRSDEPRRGHHH